MSILDGEVRAEESDAGRRRLREVARAEEIRVSDDELAARLRDDVAEIRPVNDPGQELAVLVVHLLPVAAVHTLVVEEVALRAPRFLEDLRPLDARIHLHLELCDVDIAVPGLAGAIRADDSPALPSGVQQLLAIGGDGIRTHAVDEAGRGAFFHLIALEVRGRSGRAATDGLEVKHRSCRPGGELAEITDRYVHVEDARADASGIDAGCRCPRSDRRRSGGRCALRNDLCRSRRLRDDLVARLRQERRWS